MSGTEQPRVPIGGCVYVVSPDDKLLLVEQERYPRDLRGAGQRGDVAWQCVGGGMEAGETVEECAIREAYEESGLRVRLVRLVRINQIWHEGALQGIDFVFLGVPDPWPQEVVLPEIDGHTRFLRYRWFSREDVRALEGLHPFETCADQWPGDVIEPILQHHTPILSRV